MVVRGQGGTSTQREFTCAKGGRGQLKKSTFLGCIILGESKCCTGARRLLIGEGGGKASTIFRKSLNGIVAREKSRDRVNLRDDGEQKKKKRIGG